MIVKICGVTRVIDALLAVSAGADWIGINMWPGSKRYVPLALARDIAAAVPTLVRVVVLVHPSPSDVDAALGFADLVQFHGEETPAECAPFANQFIKAVRPGADLTGYATDLFLFDTPSEGYGGSGRTFDWKLAVAPGRRVLLAGGLTADNVGEAVRVARPFGVDCATGVESAPGIKDADKVRRFVDAARAAAGAAAGEPIHS